MSASQDCHLVIPTLSRSAILAEMTGFGPTTGTHGKTTAETQQPTITQAPIPVKAQAATSGISVVLAIIRIERLVWLVTGRLHLEGWVVGR